MIKLYVLCVNLLEVSKVNVTDKVIICQIGQWSTF